MYKTLTTMTGAVALALSALLHAAAPASLVDAAMAGNKDAVRTFRKQGADVNTTQGDGMTALHWAAQKGDIDLAKTLPYAGANVKATTRVGGYTPLIIAAKNGNAPMIETLTAGGADANSATLNGTTALMFAAQAGNADAVKALLDKGADVNAKEKIKGETAVMIAAAYGRTEVIRALAAKGADLKVTTKVMDLAAFNKEEQERFAQFQQQAQTQNGNRGGRGPAPPEPNRGGGRGFNPNAKPGIDRQYNYTELVAYWGCVAPLHFAPRQGQIDATQAHLEAGADINQQAVGDNSTALVIAAVNGHFDLAKMLLEKVADPNL